MTTVALSDGREVASDSPEWQAECLARHNHVQAIMALRGKANQGARNAYVEQVDFLEGAEAGRRLRERVRTIWPKGGGA